MTQDRTLNSAEQTAQTDLDMDRCRQDLELDANSADSSDRLQCWDRSSCEAELNCRRKSITSSFSSSSILVVDGWSFQYFLILQCIFSHRVCVVSLSHIHTSCTFCARAAILSAARESLSSSSVTRHNKQALFDVSSANNKYVRLAHSWQLGITWCPRTDTKVKAQSIFHSISFHYVALEFGKPKTFGWWGHGLKKALFLLFLFLVANINVGIPPLSQCGINLPTWKGIPPILIITLVFQSINPLLPPPLSPGQPLSISTKRDRSKIHPQIF